MPVETGTLVLTGPPSEELAEDGDCSETLGANESSETLGSNDSLGSKTKTTSNSVSTCDEEHVIVEEVRSMVGPFGGFVEVPISDVEEAGQGQNFEAAFSQAIGPSLGPDVERPVAEIQGPSGGQESPLELRPGEPNSIQETVPAHDLEDLGSIFTEDEVWGVIREMQPDCAPGPDGFSGGFYQRAWPIIKRDIMAAVLKLFVGDGRGFGKLNGAIITLIPKRLEAVEVGDYRPISLVHSFAKLFSKILANRLRPKMHSLVSTNQSAFIKGRNLHDNFMLVRQLARKINSRKEVGVLLKLDISRAFDSLSWSFLFEVLRHLGFPEIWLRWVAIALRSATTRVLVNGVPGRKIYHARGLRQGDPLSPQLFVLMMEVATCLIRKAVEEELFSPIGNCTPEQRLSIYADDVVLFVKPNSMDLMAVREILGIFGEASGLRVNYLKTMATMIRGTILDKEAVGQALHCNIVDFPIRYLGLHLALRPLTKAQWQPMLDAAMHIMPAWQRGMISRPGRLTLVKAVMTARPVHHLLVLEAPCWVLEELEKNLRGFFWAGKEKAHGG
ncbi:hypothetical protein ACQ4PT_040591 [Festuca glaucescens]